MSRPKKVWLKHEVTLNGRGNYEIAGDDGSEPIAVELDKDITPGMTAEEAKSAILAMHGRIQTAARRRYDAGEAYPVYHFHSDRLEHRSIALTALDLAEV